MVATPKIEPQPWVCILLCPWIVAKTRMAAADHDAAITVMYQHVSMYTTLHSFQERFMPPKTVLFAYLQPLVALSAHVSRSADCSNL